MATNKKIEVLLLADRDPKSLWPLTERFRPCLLPLGGKPLIIHALEALGSCVSANVTIVIATEDEATPAVLADCGFPTLDVTISRLPRPFVEADMLVMRGDIVVSSRAIEDMVMEFEDESGLTRADPVVGVWRLAAGEPVPTWRQAATLSGDDDRMLPDLAAFWRMALSSGNSDFSEITAAGWVNSDSMRVGMNARVLTRRAPGRGVSVGAEAFIDKHVVLGDNAIIGDRAYIAKGAKISRSVIMPDTFVGPNVMLDQVIVSGGWLCRIDNGSITQVKDHTMLAHLAA